MAIKILLLVMLCCFLLKQNTADIISRSEVERVQSKLRGQLGNIPLKIREILAIFDKHMYLTRCLPTKRAGSCHESPSFCSLPFLKVGGKNLKVKFGICKNPWRIKIGFQLPRSPWYLKWGFGPLVIAIHSTSREGVIKMRGSAKGDVKALGFLRLIKGQLNINGILRYDRTKPTYNQALRVRYNTGYNDGRPGLDYNKLYYKLHVRMEVKKKRFPCFCYRCYKDYCRDIVKTQGHFGAGPVSCIRDVGDYYSRLEKERLLRRRKQCRTRPFRCPAIP